MRFTLGLVLLLGVAAAASGCGEEKKRRSNHDDDNGGSGQSDGGGAMGGAGGAGGSTTDPNGPQFLSLESDVGTLYENGSAYITAVLTDPDGAGDIVSGTLADQDGGSYGSFFASGQPGAFQIDVSWSAINEAGSIDFDYGSSMTRTFIAEFVDAEGHTSSKNLSIDLACSSGWEGCDGNCFDTMYDDYNCGTCGHECASDLCVIDASCSAGSCSAGEQVDCSWMDSGCTTGACNPSNGNCEEQQAANNTPCDDLDICTSNDVCTSGVCSGTPVMGGGVVFAEDFSDNLAGWQLGTEWQIGPATVSSGQSALNPDPANDHSATVDDGVAGVVIGGNASTTIHTAYYLTSPVVNTLAVQGTLTLQYYRWLNSDYSPYMTNTVEVYNGQTWVVLWQSGASPATQDASWLQQTHDITPYKNAQMKVRFGFAVGASGAYTCSQWNLDDVQIISGGGMCN
jgi:hypothetical protein